MRILVVDDEEMQRSLLMGFLQKQGFKVVDAANGHEALLRFSEAPFQLVLLDHRMPDLSGDQVLKRMKESNPLVRGIMITAFGSVDTAVKVMKLGADDFLEKPVDLTLLLKKIQRIENAVMVEEEAATVESFMDEVKLPMKVIGKSKAMKETLSLVRRIAPTQWTVLIKGETGTGKELIARLIHFLSSRRQKPFIEVNCAAIPEALFESELFGHEKGAFTGASSNRKGRFEMAEGGTIFLDEIGELPLSLQPKLLRALQGKRITRVGSDTEIPVDTRVLAATNRDLRTMVEEGLFREDLYYRLNVLDIGMPPLRRRKEDIPILIDFFMERYGTRHLRFDADAMATLIKYTFPGNVRELEHMIQRTVTLCRSAVITSQDLPGAIRFYQAADNGSLTERLKAVERQMLGNALEENGWIQTQAADALGISERVLRYKMKKHQLKRP
ncbi:MAG: sigma-54-dependent Fis family transcriptional regulator [Desulfobacterium sp.]|nr:sigma-54-dependent Fis family transcriptional regulator [Desulfobacterium sp.]